MEEEEGSCFHAYGFCWEQCLAVLTSPLANSNKPGSPQLFWVPSCMSYFGFIVGESQFNFPPILTKTTFSKVTKQEVVGQSPVPVNINTVNPKMTSFL